MTLDQPCISLRTRFALWRARRRQPLPQWLDQPQPEWEWKPFVPTWTTTKTKTARQRVTSRPNDPYPR